MTTTLSAPTLTVLDALRTAPSLLAAIELIDPLADAVRADGDRAEPALRDVIHDTDQLAAIAAVHAAGGSALAGTLVVPLLDSSVPFLREHAVWSLRSSPRLPEAVPRLHEIMHVGGFTGMLAEATLEAWGCTEPDPAPDRDRDVRSGAQAGAVGGSASTGLTVAQLFLHADIDGSLLQAGKGDTGGIATLLVRLGDSLVADPRIARVLTLSRRHHGEDDDTSSGDVSTPGHHYLGVRLPGPARPSGETWPLRVHARRGMRRALASAGRVDVLHLRMADVGSWVAAEVAHELGIPTVLTLAPDPHALIGAREASGTLTRAGFGAADHAEHLVFRVRLLRQLAADAARLVVFPRPHLEQDLRDLLQLDLGVDDPFLRVVPEGIDLAPLDRADREVRQSAAGEATSTPTQKALTELDSLLATLPAERRGLPLVVTVGRLHRVKGVATLVDAWASEPACAQRCNLLVVGGDLEDPNGDEREQLERIDAVVPRDDAARRGLLLAGHRPNGVVATWLAAVRLGRRGLAAPGGIYVSASLKEEFGIAILEALASRLVVVAPREGGPATYVEDGVTGLLVDTTSRPGLAAAIGSALDLAAAPDAGARADRARTQVADELSIATMATSLAALYSEVAHDAARYQS
ncbi:glycosyltransferase [Knoellia sp. Soil729]|uniref:glycosyltransferase n=1 Tax=Knoellia sp. Soil729 TaxID=1736394 RepID=UPI0006F79D41|nr:glycosyltransferase [Knoellia sp. Soil729]KRE43634.1 hypothetical protein ASG74_01990 [Knoellia sp. Soil729]